MLCASFSPGGMFLATGCADHHVRVYAMFGQEGPERILELEAHGDRVDSIQWANSGLRFISGSKDGTAIMWRYEKQEWRTTRLRMTTRLEGSAAALNTESLSELGQKLKVTMVTWSRNDRWLITAVSDFSIKMYSRSFQESKYLKFYADPENVTFPWFKNSHNKNYGYKYIINIFMLRQQTKVYFVKLQFMEPMIFRMIFCYNEWSTIILIYTIQ